MKTISIEAVAFDVASEISLAEGKIRLTLIPAHRTRVYSVYRYPKSPQERRPREKVVCLIL